MNLDMKSKANKAESRNALTKKMLEAQEQERKRISNEIHDELGQSLALMRSTILGSMKTNQDAADSVQAFYHSMLDSTDKLIVNMRRITKDLSPYIVEDLGLISALEWLVENFSQQHAISQTINIQAKALRLTTQQETNIYRLFQEALTNISKHASATAVQFSISLNSKSLVFTLEDNGAGFSLDSTYGNHMATMGLGFATMHERAQVVGGKISISSKPNSGTIIRLAMPL